VEGLQRGRFNVRETKPVKPIPDEQVAAVLPKVNPVIRAMIQAQELAGMRPQDIRNVRTCDIEISDGEPLLVVTSEVNAKLTQILEPILADVRRLVGDQRRMTVIFDRGGFSPKLFARLIDAGFDVITYRKGKSRKLPSGQFAVQRQKIDGAWREYQTCDRPRVRVGTLPAEGKGKRRRAKARKRYLWMREVRVLRDDGRQTPILTNRQDLSAVTVAYASAWPFRVKKLSCCKGPMSRYLNVVPPTHAKSVFRTRDACAHGKRRR
jgi:hypothetical protein